MADFITRTAKLVPYAKRPKQVPSFVTAYAHEPLPDEDAALYGNYFVVMEVLAGGRQSDEVATLIIESFGERYYSLDDTTTEALTRFEHALRHVNEELSEYVNQGNAAWIGKLSAVIAVQHGDELHLSHTGSAEAYLYRGKSAARITGQPPSRNGGPSKTFGSIASGQLDDDDRLLLATPSLLHQLPLARLQSVVSSASPSRAIAEITELLKDSSTERIAALVIAVTTPEQAALQVRSDEPDEIRLGSPETVLEAAKYAAAPIAQATVDSTKRVGSSAKTGWERTRPKLQQAGYKAAGGMRQIMSRKHGRRAIGIALVVLVIGISLATYLSLTGSARNNLVQRYNNDYQASKDPGNLTRLKTASTDISRLTPTQTRSLDKALANTSVVPGAPRKTADLAKLLLTSIDKAEGVTRVTSSPVASFSGLGSARITYAEYAGGNAYLVDDSQKSSIYVVNISTKSFKKVLTSPSGLGHVTATALAGDGSGMYLANASSQIWFYQFDTGSLTALQVAGGSWERIIGLASYMGNLYVLSDDAVYKHVRSGNTYSAKVLYLSATLDGMSGASALAIDGNIYVVGPNGLSQYLAGTFKTSASLPSGFDIATSLKISSADAQVIATSKTDGHIAVWSNRSGSLKSDYQLVLDGNESLAGAYVNDTSKTGYAITPTGLVSFILP